MLTSSSLANDNETTLCHPNARVDHPYKPTNYETLIIETHAIYQAVLNHGDTHIEYIHLVSEFQYHVHKAPPEHKELHDSLGRIANSQDSFQHHSKSHYSARHHSFRRSYRKSFGHDSR